MPDLSSCVKAWRKGVSGLQIKRTMDIAYQTAWYLCHRIRAVQRGGMIRLQVIPNATKAVLQQFIKDNTAPDTEAIYTDEPPAYWGIEDSDTKHRWLNHSAEEWVVGDVHTNGIESVWSLLKRSIIASYHKLSIKHLDAYRDELEHRFNNRKNEHIFRDTLKKLVSAAKLPDQDLVHKEAV